jgi:hypothetical protein
MEINRPSDNTWTDVLSPALLCYTTAPRALRPLSPLARERAIAVLHAPLATAWRTLATVLQRETEADEHAACVAAL